MIATTSRVNGPPAGPAENTTPADTTAIAAMIDEGGPIRWAAAQTVAHPAPIPPIKAVPGEAAVPIKGPRGHRVVLLATESLSADEQTELQGFIRPVLAEESGLVRPVALRGDGDAWSSPQWLALVEKDGHVVSQAGILLRRVRVDQQLVRVAVISSVFTHPAGRGQGLATAALGKATDFARRRLALPFALAICPPAAVSFLLHQGWQITRAPLRCEQPAGGASLAGNVVMVLPLTDSPWPEGAIDFTGSPW